MRHGHIGHTLTHMHTCTHLLICFVDRRRHSLHPTDQNIRTQMHLIMYDMDDVMPDAPHSSGPHMCQRWSATMLHSFRTFASDYSFRRNAYTWWIRTAFVSAKTTWTNMRYTQRDCIASNASCSLFSSLLTFFLPSLFSFPSSSTLVFTFIRETIIPVRS